MNKSSSYYKDNHGHRGYLRETDKMLKNGYTPFSLSRVLDVVDDLFEEYQTKKIKSWINSGTLLSCVRDSSLIPWIKNVNISTLVNEETSSYESRFCINRSILLERYELVDIEKFDNFNDCIIIKIMPNRSVVFGERELGYGVIDDFIFIVYKSLITEGSEIFKKISSNKKWLNPKNYHLHINDMYVSDNLHNTEKEIKRVFYSRDIRNRGGPIHEFPSIEYSHVDFFEKGFLNGREYNIPNNPKKILEEWYGKSWMIAQKDLHCTKNKGTTEFALEHWKKIEMKLSDR